MVEMLLVLALLGVCFAVGGVALSRGVEAVEARGAAQSLAGSRYLGASRRGVAGSCHRGRLLLGRLAVRSDIGTGGADLGAAAPAASAIANVVRWQQGEGVVVRFLAGSAYPNSAGSLYFRAPSGDYRVTVRLESGLTVRSRVEAAP